MKTKLLIYLVSLNLFLFIFVNECIAFEIIKPKAGSIFHPGDKILVEVKINPDEQLTGVMFYARNMKHTDLDFIPPFTFQFTVQPEFLGEETIVANGKLQDNSHIETSIQIKITLPQNVQLEKIEVEPRKIYLSKVQNDTQGAIFYEKKQLYVYGSFSDGITRLLSSSSSGTKYSSSDENIVTVNSEGLVSAVSAGRAQVIIENGNEKQIVNVKVKLKK